MKKLIFLLFSFTLFSATAALAVSTSLSGPSSTCPGGTLTYSFSATTQSSTLFPISFVRIRVTGTGNTLFATANAANGSVCTTVNPTTVICSNGAVAGSGVSGTAFATWATNGSIILEAFNGGGSVTSSKTINVNATAPTPGSITIGGASPVNTIETFAYSALTNPFSHTLTNTTWSISPTFGFTLTAPNQNSRLINFNTEGNYTITVSGTVITPCGNSATRTSSRIIVVDNDEAPQPLIADDGPIVADTDRANPNDTSADLVVPTPLAPTGSEAQITPTRLAPNPVQSNQMLQVTLSDEFVDGNVQAQIFDSNGRLMKVLPLRGKTAEIAVNEFSAGWYILRLSNSTESETIKFIVK